MAPGTASSWVETILRLLEAGTPFFPVIIQQNDPQRRIVEGNHRAAAMRWLGCDCLPTFLAGYRNWFIEDELMPDFDREDEVVPAPLKEAFAFFRRATCVDQKGIHLNILDGGWLGQCDEAIVARFKGWVIGAATITIRKGRPALQTVYTLKQYRRKGVAYRLCVAALLRFQEAGVDDIICDVQSEWIATILNRLERERPDLRALVKAHMDYRPGIGIEVGDDYIRFKEQG